MCGIAGWYRRQGRPVDPATITAQCDTIVHRGPDDSGVLAEGDFGNPVILGCIGLAILIVSGAPWRLLWFAGGAGLIGGVVIIATGSSYRFRRIASWLNPDKYANSDGYQLLNGKYALADGGWFGHGLGNSSEKWGGVPAPHTDFILPIIGQELGLAGTATVMFLLLFVILVAFRIADHSTHYYDRLVAFGIATWLTVQTLVNVGGVTQLFPITGVPLPFVSYGGTSTIFLMVAMGLLFSISRHNSTVESGVM